MYFDNINSTDISATSGQNSLKSAEVQETPLKKGIFDMYLNKNAKMLIDINSDNIITFDEVQNYLNRSDADNKILGKIASILGVEIKTPVDFNINVEFKNDANALLNLLKQVDKDSDNNITLTEAECEQLTKAERANINKIFGLVDGKINNKQGRYGSCWALTAGYGLSVEAPEMFNQIVKKDSEGNTVVTFYGTNEEPFSTTISAKNIQILLQKRTQVTNYNEINQVSGQVDNHKYYSSDPDGIALEIAFSQYERYLALEKIKYQENLIKYVKESEPVQIEKPDITKLNTEINQEEWNKFINYYRNSDLENKNMYVFDSDIKYLSDEMLKRMADYVNKSEPRKIEKPDVDNSNPTIYTLRNYIINSTSDTMEKPKIRDFSNHVGTINNGGVSCRAISLMAGGTYDVYYGYEFDNEKFEYKELSDSEKDKILKVLQDKNNLAKEKKIYSISFRDTDKTVRSKHAYNVFSVNEKNVYLVDPHDTDVIIPYPINKLLKNLYSLEVNKLPEKLPNK